MLRYTYDAAEALLLIDHLVLPVVLLLTLTHVTGLELHLGVLALNLRSSRVNR